MVDFYEWPSRGVNQLHGGICGNLVGFSGSPVGVGAARAVEGCPNPWEAGFTPWKKSLGWGLLLQCLAKDPADRPADAGVLLEALSSGYQSPIGTWTQQEAAAWWAESSTGCRAPDCVDPLSMEPTLEVDALARVPTTTS